MLGSLPVSLLALAQLAPVVSARANTTSWNTPTSPYGLSSLTPLRDEKCPPCFNCLLPAFTCGQYGECNEWDGQCKCPPGWGGIDCLTPQCGSLSDGEHRPLRQGDQCECNDGWGGINCNVCETDDACVGFPLAGGIESGSGDSNGVANMTCHKGGKTIFANHQMCDITNRKILDMLPDRPPQVTFSCDAEDATCSFQFWTARQESFYCALDTCTSDVTPGYDTNTTSYACDRIKCKCITGRFLCGEDGSVDISDFLKEEIRGPAKFSCKTGQGCKFEEPAMNSLINDIFGDGYITLNCNGGECLHYSQVPGYVRPPKPDNTKMVAVSAAGAGLIVIAVVALLWWAGRSRSGSDWGKIRLPENEQSKLMTDHVPASLHFSNITYTLTGGGVGNGGGGGQRTILDGISGAVKPGQVMAIMGASGAGKSTFLDILARKRKRGVVGGRTLVNGREVADAQFKKVVGFVDQEDTLMSTLTVYETVLYSALLRLPREMSLEAKKFRTLETMNELGILGIRDARIGESGRRSISGGEKRRVSIACELVTSPSILFLDEPTSGLDAYNAHNVVESLVTLARDYNRTVVFTIHQPRSNIVALFDQLVVLAQGKTVYSGEFAKCQAYFESIGQPCPAGFNIADYLIDLTVNASMEPKSPGSPAGDVLSSAATEAGIDMGDEEQGLLSPSSGHGHSRGSSSAENHTAVDDTAGPDTESTELRTRRISISSSLRRKTHQLLEAVRPTPAGDAPLPPKLAELVHAYEASGVAAGIRAETEEVERAQQAQDHRAVDGTGNGNGSGNGELRDVVVESTLLRGRRRASWGTQFRILSGRAFKNLYRDPALLAAHYLSAILVALVCGLFFHNVGNDIAGFQNRLGIFFFTLALFGFSCLSSLGLFANERILFMRERANGYYSSFTYFSSKVLFDILPLRLVPPLVFGGIVYGMVGLVPTVAAFWKFMFTLVLFNLTTASVILLLSITFSSTSVASLVGTLVMLFNLLFTGLLINRETVTPFLQWLHTVSFFHAAFEALAVNELRYLQLKEIKYGVELDVPAATILSIFGLRAQSFWWPNISLLAIFFATFTTASFLVLHFFVKEKR
ncbi:hypothetical protein CONPUDRAFT_80755 [Coniophora puteana RWD-64-598 SS2]|uniref:ABC transporter domain-containing protein n=1 Tax=Coniophora puteana (strain RWD-64-598) TaxID=741705 RepID=A0A5M3N0H0_CONPW|nr:uncharacterized protein CONPUDRAFT_80755 [Coniophora puteana RWD-64-598 SS2]EIW84405.1 hypothetical protein CONPUDRAFT_80755 [Coniophora puteana RWD-64-598 SS2]